MDHHKAGRLPDAERIYRQVLQVEPHNPDALHFLGVIAHQVGKHQLSLELIDKALAAKPDYAEALSNRALVLQELERYDEALASSDRALAIRPDYAEAWYGRGNVLLALKRHEQAVASYDKALAIRPDLVEASNNRGNALQGLGRHDEALAAYDGALAIRADYAEALNNRGNALQKLKRHDDALASYERALASRPAYAEALYNRGNALLELKRYDQAVASYDQALAIKQDHVQALHNRASSLQHLRRTEEAIATWRRALAMSPDYVEAQSALVHARQQLCDWPGLAGEIEALRAHVTQKQSGRVVPFYLLALPGAQPGEQRMCATRFAEWRYGGLLSRPALHPSAAQSAQGRKLRVGYLSADLRQHPVSNLVAEILELHDRSRFETFAYSYGADDGTPMRRRLEAAFDTFRDIAPLTDALAAQRICADRIDILVDLTGYTANSRLHVLALRPAPVQVTWLGYPGTLGHARLADYLIGDPIVTPLAHAHQFSERLALMPNCLQPNDRQRRIGGKPAREAAGLPREGFVFCCFNQSYKITPEIFDAWCRLLAAVPQSVLWLLSDMAATQRNLRQEASRRGIGPGRLIFAPRVNYDEHLARFQLADLFLDTSPINAGATGSDALWAGVPMITCMGEAFLGRYAASVLDAAGLPELIARSMVDYEKLALELATHPGRLQQIKAKLAANRSTCALFDSARFARDLERLFQRMWIDHCAGTRQHIVLDK